MTWQGVSLSKILNGINMLFISFRDKFFRYTGKFFASFHLYSVPKIVRAEVIFQSGENNSDV